MTGYVTILSWNCGILVGLNLAPSCRYHCHFNKESDGHKKWNGSALAPLPVLEIQVATIHNKNTSVNIPELGSETEIPSWTAELRKCYIVKQERFLFDHVGSPPSWHSTTHKGLPCMHSFYSGKTELELDIPLAHHSETLCRKSNPVSDNRKHWKYQQKYTPHVSQKQKDARSLMVISTQGLIVALHSDQWGHDTRGNNQCHYSAENVVCSTESASPPQPNLLP